MGETFGWCFIGSGKIANTVARQITRSHRHRIVSVFSHNVDTGNSFAQRFGARFYTEPDQAMLSEGVDAVYIATPHNSHYEYAAQALELGIPVLCEKAFTVTADQTRDLIHLASSKHVYLAEAMWTWFSPVANEVKKWLDDGEFGLITRVVVNSHVNVVSYAPRVTDPAAAGGALLDTGVYPITYLYRLFGMPSDITCTGHVSDGIDWDEDVTFTYPSGESYKASISIHDRRGGEVLLIDGTRGRTCIPGFHKARRATLARPPWKSERVSGGGTYLCEFDAVASEIREGLTQSRFVPLRATYDVMDILDECRRQLNLVYPFEAEEKTD